MPQLGTPWGLPIQAGFTINCLGLRAAAHANANDPRDVRRTHATSVTRRMSLTDRHSRSNIPIMHTSTRGGGHRTTLQEVTIHTVNEVLNSPSPPAEDDPALSQLQPCSLVFAPTSRHLPATESTLPACSLRSGQKE